MKKIFWIICPLILLYPACDPQDPVETPPPDPYEKKCIERDEQTGESFVCNELILDFSEFSDTEIQDKEKALEEDGFVKVKDCLCGKKLQLWQIPPGTDLEEQQLAAREKTGVESTGGVSFNIPMVLGPGQADRSDNAQDRFGSSKPFQYEVTVAIIDSGVDFLHNDLQDVIWHNPAPLDASDDCIQNDLVGYNFRHDNAFPMDSLGHGTHVAGIIAKAFPGNVDLNILPLKFHDGEQGFIFDAVCATYYAIEKGAKVINMSWGFDSKEEIGILTDAIREAAKAEVVVVTSAGNDTQNNDTDFHWPSNYSKDFKNVLAVANFNPGANDLDNDSNFGSTTVDLAANGVGIASTYINNSYAFLSGTSMAAADVSRTASIILAHSPGTPAADVVACINNSVTKVVNLNGDVTEEGVLNSVAAEGCFPF